MKKRPGFAHFLKKNRYVTSDWLWTSSSFLYDHRSTIMLFKLADSVLRLVQTEWDREFSNSLHFLHA